MMPPLTAPVVVLVKAFCDTPGTFVNPLGDWLMPRPPAGELLDVPRPAWLVWVLWPRPAPAPVVAPVPWP